MSVHEIMWSAVATIMPTGAQLKPPFSSRVVLLCGLPWGVMFVLTVGSKHIELSAPTGPKS